MAQFDVHEAKSLLPQLLARAEAGEEIVISREGTPCARLVTADFARPRVSGRFAGQSWAADDAFDADPDIADLFEGAEAAAMKLRSFGKFAGQGWISPDFDAPDPTIEALFEGSHAESKQIETGPAAPVPAGEAR